MAGAQPVSVYLEVAAKRVFACAVDWPGWCRSGKTEELALDALGRYAPRYAVVAAEAGVRFPKSAGDRFDVVERVRGDATTEFGAPGVVANVDLQPVTKVQAARQTALVQAAWSVFDKVVASAPAELRKGPRGGGRDRDKIVQHVVDAEVAYTRKLGIRKPPSLRDALVEVLAAPSDGKPLTEKGWPSRYGARRVAWHALDHAWEIEDRS